MPGVIFFYLRLIFSANRNATDPHGLAGWCLLHKKSYRTAAAKRGPFDVARRLIRVLTDKHTEGTAQPIAGGKPGVATWDNRDVMQIRLDHIRFNGGEEPGCFIRRDNTRAYGLTAIVAGLFYIVLFPFLFLWSVFSRNRANIALLYTEWNEAIGLMQAVRKHRIKYLYFYTPYELDANALYLLLKKEGVTVNKIPSPNLLAIANQEILSDVLTLTSPCQADELQVYKNTIAVNTIIKWLPEQFASYADAYRLPRHKPAPLSLGFYSHGSWIRFASGVTGNDLGDLQAEMALVKAFGSFLGKHSGYKCTVFLHPKEKKPEYFKAAEKYYTEMFGEGHYQFADPAVPGPRSFDQVDVGVGALSTILFERLFMKCKTIFYPAGISVFPAGGTEIERICPTSEEALEALILQASGCSTETFFAGLKLDKYTISGWKPEYRYAGQD